MFSYDTGRSPKKVSKIQAFDYGTVAFVSAMIKILEKNINEILKYPDHHNLIHD